MADEPIIQPVAVVEPPKETPAQERITQLSNTVKTTAEERDAANAKASDAERRAAFAEGFADIVSTQPGAKDHRDEIKEKVFKGYSVQDATYAVLGAAGKLGNSQPVATPQVAGGSATTTLTQGIAKEVKDMTQQERRALLEKDLMWS